MDSLKLLIVEDNDEDLSTYRATIKRYQKEKNREIQSDECQTLEEAGRKLNSSYDGAIIDLRLGKEGDAGNQVIKIIQQTYRIPIAILTGTPQYANTDVPFLGVYKKGETGYDELIDKFFLVFDTGLTRITGGRGVIEKTMQKVFWENLLPVLSDWQNHALQGKKTEEALLRYIVNHFIELLDETEVIAFPEEMYISPPISKNIKTGSIVKDRETNDFYIVLSPACDLVVHYGSIKTDSILVCKIEFSVISNAQQDFRKPILDSYSEGKKEKIKKAQERAEHLLNEVPRNKYCPYYHFLPKTSRFEASVINFRKLSSFKPSEFQAKFTQPIHQLATGFVKDIVARFSSYYSRQGQPDFDFEDLSRKLKGD